MNDLYMDAHLMSDEQKPVEERARMSPEERVSVYRQLRGAMKEKGTGDEVLRILEDKIAEAETKIRDEQDAKDREAKGDPVNPTVSVPEYQAMDAAEKKEYRDFHTQPSRVLQEIPFKEAEDANPKTAVGNTKPSVTAIPGPAIFHCALGMQNGAFKYGKYNWRESKVPAATYVDAAIRHLLAWNDGEEYAADSGVHHLGHAMASCAILLDALEGGHLIDNRGHPGTTSKVLDRMQGDLPGMMRGWEAQKRAKEKK